MGRADRRRLILLALMILVLTGAGSAQEEWRPDLTLAEERYEHYRSLIAAIGDRRENMDGAAAMAGLLTSFAAEQGISLRRQEIRRNEQFHSYGENLRFILPGSDDSRILIFAAYVTAEDEPLSRDNTAVLAALLALLEQIDSGILYSGLEITFTGSIDQQKGLREYLSRNSPQVPDLVYVLESDDQFGERVDIINGDRNIVSPLWILRYLENRFESRALPSGLANSRTQLYRLGLAAPSPLGPLLNAEYNAVGLRFAPPDHSDGAGNPETLPGAAAMPVSGVLGLLADILTMNGGRQAIEAADITGLWDQHYISGRIGSRALIIPEGPYILALLLILMSLYLWLFLLRRRRKKYFKTLTRNFWNLPLLYAAMFGFIFLGGLMVSLTESIRGTDGLWQFIPIPLLALKVTSAMFLFTLLFTVIRRIPLSKNGSFYSASAILILSIDVVIFGVINVNFSYYFLWALLWAFMFSVSRNRIAKVFCFLVSPLFILITVVDIIRLGETALIGELIGLNPGVNLLVAFILLPFLLMLIRLDFIFPHPVRGKRNFTLRYSAIAMFLIMLLNLLITLVIDLFDETNPQTVVLTSTSRWEAPLLTETDNGPKTLEASVGAASYSRIGAIEVDFLGSELSAPDGNRTVNFGMFDMPRYLGYATRREDFLGRSSYRIEFDSLSARARYIRVSLFTDLDTSIYDSNLPYRFLTGRGEIQFINGINPPDPMVLEFTLPSSAAPRINVEASFVVAQDMRIPDDPEKQFTLVKREILTLNADGNSSP
jgi:hypothetical protein